MDCSQIFSIDECFEQLCLSKTNTFRWVNICFHVARAIGGSRLLFFSEAGGVGWGRGVGEGEKKETPAQLKARETRRRRRQSAARATWMARSDAKWITTNRSVMRGGRPRPRPSAIDGQLTKATRGQRIRAETDKK